MPKLEVELSLTEIVELLEKLSPGELETLEIMLNPKLKADLKARWKNAREELETGRTLSKKELFSEK